METPGSLEAVATILASHHVEAIVVDTGAEAAAGVLARIPLGSEVYSAKSKTIEDIGLFKIIHESGDYVAVRNLYTAMDRATQGREIRKLMAAPDYMVGSVQALTEAGELVTVSYSASQLGAYASGAGRLLLVVGSQKLVADMAAADRRIREVAFPYEDARLREQFGVGTRIAKTLVIAEEARPGRTTVFLVREPLGA
jgi:hypothetical protein